ncbi:MAG: indole-3-glycerol phosphate synthase TrpC [Verrucomicrobia bacterium]|nr:indole-3-glycerol phosphate synthase TrpC [Verrucomicrobiota bacterium]
MSILHTIVARKRTEVAQLPPRPVTPAILHAALQRLGPRRNFTAALRHPRTGSVALIAEVKKASPSAGLIRPDFDAVRIARDCAAAGASCVSVLTDHAFFQGSLEYLAQIRQAVGLPLLRKDFILDPRQILEALEWGADAVLLIAAILTDDQLAAAITLANNADLTAVVEVHDEPELDRALAAGAQVVGVNNRDLNTFQVSLATTERVAARLRNSTPSPTVTLVAESGIHTRADVQRLAACGAHAILVGESLMRAPDLNAKVAELLGPTESAATPSSGAQARPG